jgi:hypothetical protein
VGDLQDDGSVVSREPFTVESVLFSVGRVPNTEALNLQVRGFVCAQGSVPAERCDMLRIQTWVGCNLEPSCTATTGPV